MLFRIVQFVFLVTALFFVGSFIYGNLDTFRALWVKPDWPLLGVAMALTVLSVLANAWSLKLIFGLEGVRLGLASYLATLSRTNLYRYIPGGIWNHAGLAMLIKDQSHRTGKSVTKLVVFNLFMNILAGLLFLAIVLPFPYMPLYLLLYVVCLLLLNAFFRFVQLVWRLIFQRLPMHLPALSVADLAKILLANILFWLLSGLSFLVFLRALGVDLFDGVYQELYIISSYIIAWVAGFLFLPAPGGLGVREFVLGYLLSRLNYVVAVGVSLSILHRLFIIVRDLMLFASAAALKNLRRPL